MPLPSFGQFPKPPYFLQTSSSLGLRLPQRPGYLPLVLRRAWALHTYQEIELDTSQGIITTIFAYIHTTGGSSLLQVSNSRGCTCVKKSHLITASRMLLANSSAHIACNPDSITDLDSLPISKSISYAAIPGKDLSDPAMKDCCFPNHVNVLGGECVEWCELPRRYLNDEARRPHELFFACVRKAGWHGITAYHPAAAPSLMTTKSMVVGIVLSTLVFTNL